MAFGFICADVRKERVQMKEKLLFVTRGGENIEEGISYVIELSKVLRAEITLLIIYEKKKNRIYEDIMTSLTFAEAGEFQTAKEILIEEENELQKTTDTMLRALDKKFGEHQRDFSYEIATGDAMPAIRDFLRNKPGIEMVLLSPNLSGNKKYVDVKKLLKTITKPIVTISRSAGSEA